MGNSMRFGILYSYIRRSPTSAQFRSWWIEPDGITNPDQYQDFKLTFRTSTTGEFSASGVASLGVMPRITGTFERIN
jgi:hypothetical protein